MGKAKGTSKGVQFNIKLWDDVMTLLQRVQGHSLMQGKRESQSDVIARLLKQEWERIEEEKRQEIRQAVEAEKQLA